MAEQPGPQRAGSAPAGLRGYVLAWVLAGVLASTVTLLTRGLPSWSATALLLLVVTTASELIDVDFVAGRVRTTFTLLEVAVAADLLLLEAPTALVVVVLGVGIAQTLRRRSALKVVFNVAQIAVATSAAWAALHLPLPAGTDPTDVAVVAPLLVGMLLYAVLTTAATAGIIARLGPTPWTRVVNQQGPQIVAVVLGNTAVGALAAALAVTYPHLLALLVAPAAAMHLSSRGAVRTRQLLTDVRAEHERLDRVVRGASDGIVLLDEAGRVVLWNPAVERITGVPADRVLGTAPTQLPAAALDGAEVFTLAPDDLEQDQDLVRADGATVAVHTTQRVLRDSHGDPAGAVVVVHDVTRQREVEALKSDFIARISHELRTPLTPIKGLAQTLVRRGEDLSPERRQEALQQILGRADHLVELVEDLLLVSQLSATHGPAVHLDAIDLGPVLEDVTSSVQDKHAPREVRLTGPAELPRVRADAAHVREIVGHLLSNAVTYSPAGSPVDVVVRPDGDTIAVDVADRGPGIPADKRADVFTAFHRLEDPLRMRTGGVGLGLYLARRLAEAMGGAIELTDRLGGGSVFTLRLRTESHTGREVGAEGPGTATPAEGEALEAAVA